MITPKDFWDQRSQIYDAAVGPLYGDAYAKTVSNTLKYLRPTHRVLDFACGTGIVTLQVAPYVAQVQAIDISNEMVSKTQAKLEAQPMPNVELSQTDLFDPGLEEGSFDAVMAFNVLCYVENLEEVLVRIDRLLKPGGYFLSATDCLGQNLSKIAIQKFIRSRTGQMPYVAFFRSKTLKQRIADCGFAVLEEENLFPAPPNLFIAAQKK